MTHSKHFCVFQGEGVRHVRLAEFELEEILNEDHKGRFMIAHSHLCCYRVHANPRTIRSTQSECTVLCTV